MFENHNQSFQIIFFFEKKPAKSEILRSRHSHRLEIAKLYHFQSPREEKRFKEASSSLADK